MAIIVPLRNKSLSELFLHLETRDVSSFEMLESRLSTYILLVLYLLLCHAGITPEDARFVDNQKRMVFAFCSQHLFFSLFFILSLILSF